MRILVVTSCFYPDTYAVNDIVRRFVERGHEVTVLTGLPDYTTSRIPEEYQHGQNRHQDYYGADVRRVPTVARRHGPFWRSLSYLSFARNGRRAALHGTWKEFDVIYVWQVSPVTMGIPAIAFKKRFGRPIFLYCMDIWPECIKAMGFHEGSPFFSAVGRVSRKVYQACDRIAVSSMPFLHYLEETDGCDRSRMCYLPQYGSGELLKDDFAKQPDGHTDFLFIGNVGKVQDMGCLLRAAAAVSERGRDFTIHIVGGGSELENSKKLAEQLHLQEKVLFYGPKPFKEATGFYRKADACLLTLEGRDRIGETLPGKLQTYMAAGKPVLGAINGAGRQVIEESGCGACVPAGDAGGLSQLFISYLDAPEKFSECGEKGRKYFRENFSEERFFEETEKQLALLIAKNGTKH